MRANPAECCGAHHRPGGILDWSCGDTAGNVTVSAVSAAGYLRDPSRTCGLRPTLRVRAKLKTTS
ncbi:hypothetical protein GTY60_14740 [Streptomyces sp. SID8367]|nr:hypothetical protein [Streptomyces sp. SID8367]